jgi:hypothetical protein
MDVKDGVSLGRGHIRPAEAERRHALLHRLEHEACLLAHRPGRLVAAPNDAPFIAWAALARFAASGSDKATHRAVFVWHGVAEGIEGSSSPRGAISAGLTWHFARPPVQGLDFENDEVNPIARSNVCPEIDPPTTPSSSHRG